AHPVHAGGSQIIIFPLDPRPVQLVGNDPACVPIPPVVKSADMIDVAVGGNNMPDPGRLKTQGSNVLFYLFNSISYACIYQNETALCIHKIDICILRTGQLRSPHRIDSIADGDCFAHCTSPFSSSSFNLNALSF